MERGTHIFLIIFPYVPFSKSNNLAHNGTLALTMIKEWASIAHVSADLTRAISGLKQAATGLPGYTTSTRNRDEEEDH